MFDNQFPLGLEINRKVNGFNERRCWAIALSSGTLLAVHLSLHPSVNAQITPDDTLSTTVTTTDNLNFTIEAGDRAGNNLFHSFDQFSVPTDGAAIFNNTADIENIFGRVTGGSISDIDGLIQAQGTASLFLMNPNGIVFGPNAQLNIGGSFLGTTAESIVFENNVVFSATPPQANALLSISTPIGLQFGNSPGPIQVNGDGHQITFDVRNFSFDRTDRPVGLQVSDRQTLALIGGDITLAGGNLTALSGRVELGSLAEGSTVSLSSNPNGVSLTYDSADRFGDISLSQAASVDVSGERGGDIQLQGRRISLVEEAIILANTLGSEDGGLFLVQATESVDIIGLDLPVFPTGFFAQVAPTGTGRAGDMTINTRRLTLRKGALIATSTSGMGNGGDLTINTESLFALEGGQGLVSSTGNGNSGNSGNLTIRSSELVELRGVLTIAAPGAPFIVISSGFLVNSDRQSAGNGGQLKIETDRLRLIEGGQLTAGTFSEGNGGDIDISANEVEVSGGFSDLEVSGELAERIDSVALNSAITVESAFSGNSGNLVITANRLFIADGGEISAEALGTGTAGSVALRVGTLDIDGVAEDGARPSRIIAFAEVGDAGSIDITADDLSVRNGAEINVNSQGSGDSGNLNVTAGNLVLDGMGQLQAAVNGGAQGNIDLNVSDLLVLRNGSAISANATGASTGGNIDIRSPFIIGLNNSDIVANAVQGNGGNIQIDTRSLFGLEFRDRLTPDSDITASSQFGINGTVEINDFNTDPDSGLVELPSRLVDPSNQITKGCASNQGNTFIVTGRGGIAANPTELMAGDRPWADHRDLSAFLDNEADSLVPKPAAPSITNEPPQEATGMAITPTGEVQLLSSPFQSMITPDPRCLSS